MTPEERAHQVRITIWANNGYGHADYFEEIVAASITAAAQAERERCAECERLLKVFVLAFATGDAHHVRRAQNALAEVQSLLEDEV